MGGGKTDTVADFCPRGSLQPDDAYFIGLALCQLQAETTDTLSYDSNGAGAGGATQFATLAGAPTLSNTDSGVV